MAKSTHAHVYSYIRERSKRVVAIYSYSYSYCMHVIDMLSILMQLFCQSLKSSQSQSITTALL